jgi:hypothetical protein
LTPVDAIENTSINAHKISTTMWHVKGLDYLWIKEDRQKAAKAEGKGRIVDLRFGNVKANAQSPRIHYQETS